MDFLKKNNIDEKKLLHYAEILDNELGERLYYLESFKEIYIEEITLVRIDESPINFYINGCVLYLCISYKVDFNRYLISAGPHEDLVRRLCPAMNNNLENTYIQVPLSVKPCKELYCALKYTSKVDVGDDWLNSK